VTSGGRHAPPSEGRGGGPRSLVGQAKRQADAVNASICLTQRLYQVQASDDQHEGEATDDNARQYGPYPSLSKNPQEKKLTYQSTSFKRGDVILHL